MNSSDTLLCTHFQDLSLKDFREKSLEARIKLRSGDYHFSKKQLSRKVSCISIGEKLCLLKRQLCLAFIMKKLCTWAVSTSHFQKHWKSCSLKRFADIPKLESKRLENLTRPRNFQVCKKFTFVNEWGRRPRESFPHD